MKNLTKLLSVIFCITVINFSCSEQETIIEQSNEISIIGIDPCTYSLPTGSINKGYVVKLNFNGDTAVTYNLPYEVAKKVDGSTVQLKEGYLLTSENIFTTKLVYSFAKEEEKFWSNCISTIDISGFSKINKKQIIIKP